MEVYYSRKVPVTVIQLLHADMQKKTRIATWNVRTMNQTGKPDFITREASLYNVWMFSDCLRSRWKNSRKCTTDEHVMSYYGHKTEHKDVVGVLLSKQVAQSMDRV